jgi:hypothetical protein
MKKNSTFKLLFFIFFACITLLVGTSCNKCKDVSCEHGTCEDGICECETGWTGTSCQTSSGGGSTNSSNGGGSTTGSGSTGSVTFWTAVDHGCGTISVTVTNYSTKSITSFYSGAEPDCGDAGCATYNLPYGTYSYTASCSGFTWGSSFTISSSCLIFKLN